MIGIDTNVLVRAFVESDGNADGEAARGVLSGLTPEEPGFITQVTMVELYWVLARSYGFDRARCLEIVRGLVETASVELDDGEGVVRALTLAEGGADFADALIQGAMELFGVSETVTFDRGAARTLGWRLLS